MTQARKLEGDLDQKISSFSKLGSTYASVGSHRSDGPDMVTATKAVEIEGNDQKVYDLQVEQIDKQSHELDLITSCCLTNMRIWVVTHK